MFIFLLIFQYELDTIWRYNSPENFTASFALITPLKNLENTSFGVDAHKINDKLSITGNLQFSPISIDLSGFLTTDAINGKALVEYSNNKKTLNLHCDISHQSESQHKFLGVLYIDEEAYNVTGNLKSRKEFPLNMQVELKPVKGGAPVTINYNYQQQPKGHAIKTTIKKDQHYGVLEIHTAFTSNWIWDVQAQLDTTHPQYKMFSIHGKSDSKDNGVKVSVNCRTPLPKLHNPKLSVSYNVIGDESKGDIIYDISDTKGHIQGSWIWIMMEKMKVDLVGTYEGPEYKREAAIQGFYFDPNRAFEKLQIGGNVRLNKTWL